jgi:SIR2-like domain
MQAVPTQAERALQSRMIRLMAGSEPKLDPNLRARLAGQLARADLILFTGAGFSLGAKSVLGRPIPSVDELKHLLWEIAFPSDDFDATSSLSDIYDVASRRAGNKVRDLFLEHFRVDPKTLDERYGLWFSLPWHRIYTLNVDDLDAAASRQFKLTRPIASLSALRDELPAPSDKLTAVHLNGRIADYPQMTFSQPQFAERAAMPDPWYRLLVAELASHAVVFVGTQLDEPPLWQQIELRRRRVQGEHEFRPGSYLVTPSLSQARRAVLEQYNIDWVPLTEEQFASELATLRAEAQQGHRVLAARADRSGAVILRSVAELRNQPPTGDEAEFLLGREPDWRDLTHGFAVQREFEADIPRQIEAGSLQVLVVTGTAGTGKSTTLMRFALAESAAGKSVYWLDANTGLRAWEVRKAVRDVGLEVLVVDDADAFGDGTAELLADFVTDNSKIVVVASIRSTRYERLQVGKQLSKIRSGQITIPNLVDQDIDLLLDALTRAKRLGQLRGKTREERIALFRERAGRQLLVAMIEVTSGERFEEKIDRECRELGPELGLLYAELAVATSYREYLTRDELLLATGGNPADVLSRLDSLLRQHLVLQRSTGLTLRHRVVADHAMSYFREQGQLVAPLQGLAFALATKAHPGSQRNTREMRFVRRLISHERLIRLIGHRRAQSVYEGIEDLLAWDYHYWLQRGSLEVEEGDLRLAQNFLGQAYAMAENDHRVQTEWAYMNLKRAAQEPTDPDSRTRADTAMAELEAAIAIRGRKDSYPYHILGSQGLRWSRRGPLSREERKQILNRLRSVVQEGVKNYPFARDLAQLHADLTKEALLLATEASDGGTSPSQ